MYVCHCNVVTDGDIVESIANGARCVADVARETGRRSDLRWTASARCANWCASIARSWPSESWESSGAAR